MDGDGHDPTGMGSDFGFMNWTLNAGGASAPSAPTDAFYHSGAGANRIYVDPRHDLVVALRWVSGDHFDGFISRLLAGVSE